MDGAEGGGIMPFYVSERRHDAMYLGGETRKVQEGKKTAGKSEEAALEQNQLRGKQRGMEDEKGRSRGEQNFLSPRSCPR